MTDRNDPSVWRILDACGNRAREGLRVVEDYVRFALDDAHLMRRLKECRHELSDCLAALPAHDLLRARDTQADVGTNVSTAREWQRGDAQSVLSSSFKRVQESLRSLEEYAKLLDAALAERLEKLRYTAYTLERAVVLTGDALKRLADARLYVLVTHSAGRCSFEEVVKGALEGGAHVIQLREKGIDDRELLGRARDVRRWTRDAGALFIMNDRPDLAVLSDADGVHVGQDELTVHDVRRIVGPRRMVGVSTHDLEQAEQAVLDGAGYIGVGPVFASGTKAFDRLAGLEFVRQAAQQVRLPAFAVGGIDRSNVKQVIAAGVRRVAVSSAICQAEDPRAAARELRAILE